jgi:prepilin-type N-terminal cleavage/methylation domain-containing protein
MNRSSSERGFTILELTIVITLIGVMTSIAVPRFMGLSDHAATAACKQNQGAIESVCKMYLVDDTNPDLGRYPLQISDLVPRYFDAEPECPVAGRYGYDSADGSVNCGAGGHTI